MRSADLWPKKLVPNSPNEWNLISVALCGQQPSVLNLPAVVMSTHLRNGGVVQFAVTTDTKRGEAELFVDSTLPELKGEWRQEAITLATGWSAEQQQEHLPALRQHFGITIKVESKPLELAADAPKSMNSAITQFAAENKIEINSTKNFELAERGAMRTWPALWRR